MKKWSILFCMLVGGFYVHAQIPIGAGNSQKLEPLSINYGVIPDLGNTEVANYGLNVSIPKRLGKGVMIIRLGYQHFDFTFNESTNVVDVASYQNMHTVRTSISYLRPLENSWGILFSGGTSLMSNFGDGISGEDFVFNAILGFTKNWGDTNRNSNLLVGAFYGTQFGEPTVFPALSFNQKLNAHWSYSLGIPVTGITYTINPKHRLSVLASPQGLYGNNSNTIAVDGNRTLTNTKLQFNGINTRISYRYLFTKNLAFVGEIGYIPNPTLKILDNENEEIFDFKPESGAYANVGLRFVIQKQSKNDTK